MEDTIKIPVTKQDITLDWVQEVTGHSVLDEGFVVEGDIEKGNGFLSSICRVSYKSGDDGKRHSIIVKLLPTNSEWLEFALADASDEREIKFYSTILPDLFEVVPELKENIGEFYMGAVKQADPSIGRAKASMLIMEDLTAKGFKMMSFSGDNSDETMDNLVTFMARFHYAAFALEQKKGIPLKRLYPYLQGIQGEVEWIKQLETLGEGGYEALEKLLSSHNMPKEIYEKYDLLKPYTSAVVRKISKKGGKHPCLIHGDIWPPNLQVHDSLPVKVIDWQMLGHRDVTYDLSVLFLTVLPKEKLTRARMTELLQQYFTEFEDLCKAGEFKDKIKRRTWEEFEEFYFTWGLAYSYMVMQPSVYCYTKDFSKYANIFRAFCEDYQLPQFLFKECTKEQ